MVKFCQNKIADCCLLAQANNKNLTAGIVERKWHSPFAECNFHLSSSASVDLRYW
jgi:hypothetical protein